MSGGLLCRTRGLIGAERGDLRALLRVTVTRLLRAGLDGRLGDGVVCLDL